MIWLGPNPVLNFVTELCDIAEEKMERLKVTPGFLQDWLPGFKNVRDQFISSLQNQPNLNDLLLVFLLQLGQGRRILIIIRGGRASIYTYIYIYVAPSLKPVGSSTTEDALRDAKVPLFYGPLDPKSFMRPPMVEPFRSCTPPLYAVKVHT